MTCCCIMAHSKMQIHSISFRFLPYMYYDKNTDSPFSFCHFFQEQLQIILVQTLVILQMAFTTNKHDIGLYRLSLYFDHDPVVDHYYIKSRAVYGNILKRQSHSEHDTILVLW